MPRSVRVRRGDEYVATPDFIRCPASRVVVGQKLPSSFKVNGSVVSSDSRSAKMRRLARISLLRIGRCDSPRASFSNHGTVVALLTAGLELPASMASGDLHSRWRLARSASPLPGAFRGRRRSMPCQCVRRRRRRRSGHRRFRRLIHLHRWSFELLLEGPSLVGRSHAIACCHRRHENPARMRLVAARRLKQTCRFRREPGSQPRRLAACYPKMRPPSTPAE